MPVTPLLRKTMKLSVHANRFYCQSYHLKNSNGTIEAYIGNHFKLNNWVKGHVVRLKAKCILVPFTQMDK